MKNKDLAMARESPPSYCQCKYSEWWIS